MSDSQTPATDVKQRALLRCSQLRSRFPASPWRPPKRVVIFKPCCVGDVLLATPALAAFHRTYPEAQFFWAVAPHARPLVARNPRLAGLVNTGPIVGGGRYTWGDLLKLAKRLRALRCDTAIYLERSLALSLVLLLAGIPQRLGLDSQGRGLFLTHRVPVPIEPRHEAELYLDTARRVGVPVEGVRLEYTSSAEARQRVRQLVSGDRPVAVIHPAGGENPGGLLLSKRWPASRFAELARRLDRAGAHVMVVGGPADRCVGEQVAGTWGNNLAGRLSWDETAALLEQAALFVGNDTGAMHLAVACGTPTVAIFGPTDPRRYGPYGPRAVALWRQVGCNPCFEFGRARPDCCPNNAIAAIQLDEVLAAAAHVSPQIAALLTPPAPLSPSASA